MVKGPTINGMESGEVYFNGPVNVHPLPARNRHERRMADAASRKEVQKKEDIMRHLRKQKRWTPR